MSEETIPTLASVLKQHDIVLTPKKIRLLEEYCQELWTWNEKINLTRHTDYEKFVSHDVIDSIQLAQFLQKGEHVLDVGTGGGVPGIIIAILRPDVLVELCDSTGKKAKAVGEILDKLGLNLNVWYAKAENLLKVHRFQTLVIRGLSKMEKLLRHLAPYWFAFDRILMVKGPHWIEERGEARHLGQLNSLALRKLSEYETPGAEHTSVILQVCRKSRFEEMKQRDLDREAGKPIAEQQEVVGVDNSVPRKPRKPGKGFSDKKHYSQDRKSGKGPRGESSTRGKRSAPPGRSREKFSSRPENKNKGKGWVE